MSGTADWGVYSRIYHSLMTEKPTVWNDDRLLAAWTRLLVMSDQAWPAPAPLPRWLSLKTFDRLCEHGVLETAGSGYFRFAHLDEERGQRSKQASQSASLRWARPRIEGGRPASRRTRFKVLERDGYRCRYCGRTSQEVAIDVDHIVPVREGGTDELSNLVSACVDCNMGKSGHPLEMTIDARASSEQHARASGTHMPSKAEQSKEEQNDARADIEAFLLVRRRLPTPAQRGLMDRYLATFNVSGPERAERLILSHPDDPIGALKADLDAFRKERLEKLGPEDPKPAPRRSNTGLTGINAELAELMRQRYETERKPEPEQKSAPA